MAHLPQCPRCGDNLSELTANPLLNPPAGEERVCTVCWTEVQNGTIERDSLAPNHKTPARSNPYAFPVMLPSGQHYGVTLRDHFAGLAMRLTTADQGIVNINPEQMDAEAAYRKADEMLKARELKYLPAISWGTDREAILTAIAFTRRALDIYGRNLLNQNPQGTPEERAMYKLGWMLITMTSAFGDVIADSDPSDKPKSRRAIGGTEFFTALFDEVKRLTDRRVLDISQPAPKS